MNPPLRFGLLFLLLFFSLSVQARATCLAHPTDPTAFYLGSFILTFPVNSGGNGLLSGECETEVEVCIWLIGGNRVDYVLNIGTMTFEGDCDDVDEMPFAEIMDQAAAAAVERGTELDYTGCGDTTDVWVGQCADRAGSGEETTFSPCNSAWCKRRYLIVCGVEGIFYQQLTEQPAVCNAVGPECEKACTEVE